METDYGTLPTTFTSVNLGHIQSINISEEENIEKLSSLNSGHTAATFEDGLYWASVSIETKATKASLPQLLKMCLGTVDETTDYTASSSLTLNSYAIKVSYLTTNIVRILGFAVKDFSISITKGETVAFTINGIAKITEKVTETLNTTTNTDKIFSWLDASVTVNSEDYVLNNFTIEGNWNVTDDEGRGIETVPANERRLIQTVIKNRFDISGSYEMEIENTAEIGYEDERTDEAIVLTLERGTDNEHVFTLAETRSGSREYNATIENGKKVVSYNYEALDLSVTGDL